MARIEVLLPQWGMGMSEGTVTSWLKVVGDTVAEDEAPDARRRRVRHLHCLEPGPCSA